MVYVGKSRLDQNPQTDNTDTDNNSYHLTEFLRETTIRRRIVAVCLGFCLSVPCLLFLLYGTQTMETAAMQNQPWGSGVGMAALLAGLFCYFAICLISGILSGYGLLPLIIITWLASLAQSTSQSFWFWKLWITLGWSSFLPLITAIFMGAAYSIWYVRYESRISSQKSLDSTSETVLSILPDWIKTLFITLPIALLMALTLFIQADNITPTFSQEGKPVAFLLSSSALPALTVIATMVISLFGLLLSGCHSKSVFSTAISSFLVLIIPGLLISFIGLSSFGVNTEFTFLQTWGVCSPIMGIVGSLVVITGVAVIAARNNS